MDALRGVAILAIVFFHFTFGREEANLGFKLGTTCLDLLFIISGFVIMMSIHRVKSSFEFIIKRIVRLYPTYWTAVTFTFLLISTFTLYYNKGEIDFVRYLGNMTMFQFYLKIKNLDGPYWTMIIELIFYFVVLFLFHFKKINHVNIIFSIISVITVVLIHLEISFNLIHNILTAIPFLQFTPVFLAGSVFYNLYKSKNQVLLNYFILCLSLVCQILLFNNSGRSNLFISHFEYSIMLVIYYLIFILFINGKLKFIVSKGTLFLGKISYALYLIHQQISIGYIIPILTFKYHVNFWLASCVIALPVSICLAALITFQVEIPLLKKIKLYFSK